MARRLAFHNKGLESNGTDNNKIHIRNVYSHEQLTEHYILLFSFHYFPKNGKNEKKKSEKKKINIFSSAE